MSSRMRSRDTPESPTTFLTAESVRKWSLWRLEFSPLERHCAGQSPTQPTDYPWPPIQALEGLDSATKRMTVVPAMTSFAVLPDRMRIKSNRCHHAHGDAKHECDHGWSEVEFDKIAE